MKTEKVTTEKYTDIFQKKTSVVDDIAGKVLERDNSKIVYTIEGETKYRRIQIVITDWSDDELELDNDTQFQIVINNKGDVITL